MVVRLPEDSLPAAFAGVCACKHQGGCDRPGAVPVELAEHVDFVEGIGDPLDASRDLRQRARSASRDYNPGNRRLAAKRKSRSAPETTLQTREFDAISRSGPWYPGTLKHIQPLALFSCRALFKLPLPHVCDNCRTLPSMPEGRGHSAVLEKSVQLLPANGGSFLQLAGGCALWWTILQPGRSCAVRVRV